MRSLRIWIWIWIRWIFYSINVIRFVSFLSRNNRFEFICTCSTSWFFVDFLKINHQLIEAVWSAFCWCQFRNIRFNHTYTSEFGHLTTTTITPRTATEIVRLYDDPSTFLLCIEERMSKTEWMCVHESTRARESERERVGKREIEIEKIHSQIHTQMHAQRKKLLHTLSL